MMDETIYPIDLPRAVGTVRIIALHLTDPTGGVSGRQDHKIGDFLCRCLAVSALRAGWLRSPSCDRLPAASLDDEIASAMPIPNQRRPGDRNDIEEWTQRLVFTALARNQGLSSS